VTLDLQYIMDTLGIYSDTILQLAPENVLKKEAQYLYDPPIVEPGPNTVKIATYFKMPAFLDTSQVLIVDSTGKPLPMNIKTDNFFVYCEPEVDPDYTMPYTLKMRNDIPYPDGKSTDTTITFEFQFPDVEKYGGVIGEIMPDTANPNMKLVALILRKGKSGATIVKRLSGPGPFRIDYLEEGSYELRVIKDADGNGFLSPGSLRPFFLPEKTFVPRKLMEIRGNWELDGFKIYPYATPQDKKKGKTKGSEDEKSGDGSKDSDDEHADQDHDDD
ncbi:MAG: hypothetical protein AAF570_03355, partial [Bacteroidota bacterium]